jgi:acyl carrier protein
MDSLPRTPNGKVNRKALPAPDISRPELEKAFAAPRTEVEKAFAEIWIKILKVDRVGIHDNFFELGGHSLLVAYLVSRIREAFNLELPIRKVFEEPTIAELAGWVEKKAEHPPAGNTLPAILPVPRGEHLPASFGQVQLWLLEQLYPDLAMYNSPKVICIAEPVNAKALEKAFNEVVRRHEVLRTSFNVHDGIPVQVVHDHLEVSLPVFDLTTMSKSEQEAEILRLGSDEVQSPFDLSQAPLFRGRLIKFSETDHRLIMVFHHIVSDYITSGIFIKEMRILHQAFSAQKPSPLSPLPIQYADYACWQRQVLKGQVYQEKIGYWKKKLDGLEPINLPTDHPRSPIQTLRGDRQSFNLSKKLVDRLKALSIQEGVTLFVTLLSAFKAQLWRYTQQSDIAVGTVVHGRNRPEVESLMGYFLNTLVLRTDMSGTTKFSELMKRVRPVVLEALDHQEIPFSNLVEELQPKRDPNYNPLFQVAFILEPQIEIDQPNWSSGRQIPKSGASKFDLTLWLVEKPDGMVGVFKYDAGLFEDDTITQMIGHFQIILSSIAANSDQRLSDLDILTKSERKLQSVKANGVRPNKPYIEFTEEAIEQSIPERFQDQVKKFPQNIAVKTKNHEWTYEKLNQESNRVCQAIVDSYGLGNERIAVLFDHDAPMIAGILGTLKAGKTYVPLDPEYPADRLAYVLDDSQARALLTDSSDLFLAK